MLPLILLSITALFSGALAESPSNSIITAISKLPPCAVGVAFSDVLRTTPHNLLTYLLAQLLCILYGQSKLSSGRHQKLSLHKRALASQSLRLCTVIMRSSWATWYFALCCLNISKTQLTSVLVSTTVLSEICKGVPFQSRSERIITDTIILAAFTYTILAMRCISRYNVTGRIWVDDYIALLAGVSLEAIQITPT